MNSIFQVLTLAWSLQGGQYLTNAVQLESARESISPLFVTTSFQLQLPFSFHKGDKDFIYIGAETESRFLPPKTISGFRPMQDTYTFKTGIQLWSFELFYEHSCTHPVVTLGDNGSYFFSSFDKISMKLSGLF